MGYYNAGDRMKRWGKTGAFWGGFWGLLFGSAFFAIPGVGPILVAGPLVAWIVGALEGAVVVGGLSAAGAGLYSIGIPKNSVVEYETAVKSDKFVLIVHGTATEVSKAKEVLAATNSAQLDLHSQEELRRCKVARYKTVVRGLSNRTESVEGPMSKVPSLKQIRILLADDHTFHPIPLRISPTSNWAPLLLVLQSDAQQSGIRRPDDVKPVIELLRCSCTILLRPYPTHTQVIRPD